MESSRDLNIEIEFATEDFYIIPEIKQYYVVSVNGPGEEPVPVDIWSYACFFFENVQRKNISNEVVYIDGIRLDRYMEYFCKNGGVDKFADYISEFRKHPFQKEMQDSCGVHVNVFALYGLCMYVKEIINRRICILFKPTPLDTLEEIVDIDHIKEININCIDGNTHSTSSETVKELLWKSLNDYKKDNLEFEFDRVAKCVDVFTKEYAQVEFVRMMTDFFVQFFKFKRRKNCILSSAEQRMLAFLLYFFEFSPATVTEGRIRQLLNSKINIVESKLNLNFIGLMNGYISVLFIPYSDWKNGRINPLEYKPIAYDSPSRKSKFTMQMGNDTQRIHEIVVEFRKIVEDIFTRKGIISN